MCSNYDALGTYVEFIGSGFQKTLPLGGQLAPVHSALTGEEHTSEPPCLEAVRAGCETEGLEAQHQSKSRWLPSAADRQQLCHTGGHSRTELHQQT